MFKQVIAILITFSSAMSWAQFGPGGVGDNTDCRFWFALEDGLFNDGDAVDAISNRGGNTNNLFQNNNGRRPTYTLGASSMNGFGVAQFDGANDFLTISTNSDINSSSTAQDAKELTMVIRTGSDVASRQVLYEEGGTIRGLNIYIFNDSLYFGGWNLNSDGIGAPWTFVEVHDEINPNTEYIVTLRFAGNNSITGNIEGFINGTSIGTIGNVGLLYAHSGAIGIGGKNNDTFYENGSSGGNGEYFDGDIAEFILYTRNLKAAELDLQWNYLSSKYDIPLTSIDLFNKDNLASGNYDYEVAGIGQNADGSSSTDGQGTDVVRINNPSNLNVGDYLMIGHDNVPLTINFSGAPAGIQAILSQTWRVTRTNDVGTVDIMVDINASGLPGVSSSDFFLITDPSDNDFTNGTTLAASSISNGYAVFSGVNLADVSFFTFGSLIINSYGYDGPGGVGNTNQYRFWYDANDLANTTSNGSSVQTWENKGGNSNNAFQNTNSRRPTFNSSGSATMNNYPSFSFDGGDYFQIADNTDLNTGTHEERSIYMSFQSGTDISTRQVLYQEGGGTRGLNIYVFNNEIYVGAWNLANDGAGAPWGFSSVSTGISSSTDYIVSFRMDGNDSSTGEITCTLNGVDFGTINSVGILYPHSADISIGAKIGGSYFETGNSGGTGNYWTGLISEFICYNEALPEMQHELVTNYLSSKYDITIGTMDQHDADNLANGDYDHEVAGIGKISDLVFHDKAKGPSFPVISGADDIDDNEYLLWGHDDEPICNSKNVPAALTNRMTRKWRFSESGDVGNVTIGFYLGDVDYGTLSNTRLLIDSDGDFSDATVVGVSSTSGDTIFFNATNVNDLDYFTIGTLDSYASKDLVSTTWNGGSSDWSSSSNWSNGLPTEKSAAIIPNIGTSPILSGIGEAFSVEIQSGATLEISGTDSLKITENFTNNGSFIPNNSTLVMREGCASRQISISTDTDIYNVIMNIEGEVEVSGGANLNLKGYLDIEQGNFITGNALTLISDATETARILSIPDGSSVSGTATMQRYIDAGQTNWRFLSSAISPYDLEQFDDDFITSGIPGSDYPNWPSASAPWASIYTYDESIAGAFDNGFVAPTSMSYTPAPGEGLWIWCGDTITGTNPFTIDHSGSINQGDISLPVSFTNSTNDDDGWNMVGNPYPCTIDWDATDWTKTNIASAIYIWNPDTEVYASYVPGLTPGTGTGTNGGSNQIASSQAFWVYASGASPALTITEDCKVNEDQLFIKASSPNEFVRLKISNNSFSDETVIRNVPGTSEQFDYQFDAWKIYSNDNAVPQISVKNPGHDISISSCEISSEYTDTLRVQGPMFSQMTLTVDELNGFDGCFTIQDLITGQSYSLDVNTSITFTLTQSYLHDRFIINYQAKPNLQIQNITCFEENDGVLDIAMIANGGYNLYHDGTLIINAVSDTTINNLNEGWYVIQSNNALCLNNTDSVLLERPDFLSIDYSVSQNSCEGCCDASIDFSAIGGAPSYFYQIDGVASNGTEYNLCDGTYTVTVTDANNCYRESEIKIGGVSIITTETNINHSIYPNPASDHVTIQIDDQFNEGRYKVYDGLGRTLIEAAIKDATTGLDVKEYPKGIYFLMVNIDDHVVVHRLLIE